MIKAGLAFLALAAGTQALVPREEGCCFGLTAYGGPGGEVMQLGDGQNRIGDKLPYGSYCLGPDGGLTDSNGRGCILTPPTTQWQCDAGAAPTLGFGLSCNGTLEYEGADTFWSCANGEGPTGESHNIYSTPIPNEPSCTPIWLVADSCYSGCAKKTTSMKMTTSTSTYCPSSTPVAPPPKPKPSCPAELTGDWEFPHLIVPINQADAHKSYGTVLNGTAYQPISSIFQFDIPASYEGKQCSLTFLFPTQDQLETSAFEAGAAFNTMHFALLSEPITKNTNYANAPPVAYDLGDFDLVPGTATVIGTDPHGCPAGQAVSYMMSAVGSSYLNYFQDFNPCPIGLYVTAE